MDVSHRRLHDELDRLHQLRSIEEQRHEQSRLAQEAERMRQARPPHGPWGYLMVRCLALT